MKYGQKLKLGDAHVTPKKYPRGTSVKAWGCPEAPLLHRQILGHLSRHYIFIASYTMRFSWSVPLFLLSVFFCFVFCNKWLDPQHVSFGEDALRFSLPRTLKFPLFSFNECSLFLVLRLAFIFHLDFCSELVSSL
jgi:hypothetical protein